MRHLAGLFVLFVLAGIGVFALYSFWMAQRRQRRAMRRGIRINIPGDGTSDTPPDPKED